MVDLSIDRNFNNQFNMVENSLLDIFEKFPVDSILKVHLKKTAEKSSELAEMYSEDPFNAYLSGYLHDIARQMKDSDSRTYIIKNNIKVLDIEYKIGTGLLHPIIAEHFLRDNYLLDDDIFEAIRYHTTGRRFMNRLTMILMIADTIEESRCGVVFDEIREKVENLDLISAVKETLRFKSDYLDGKGYELHPYMLESLEFLNKGVILSERQ
jgi:nicotinate-nucleotide adenylyltransferase